MLDFNHGHVQLFEQCGEVGGIGIVEHDKPVIPELIALSLHAIFWCAPMTAKTGRLSDKRD